MNNRQVGLVLGGWLAAMAVALPIAGQDDQVAAYRIAKDQFGPPRIDGRLDEDLWMAVPAMSGFHQREPLEGVGATERTEVRIAYDGESLYIGVMAYDSRPDQIVARIMQRDKLFEPEGFESGMKAAGDDAIAILLDPFHDHRNGVVFATNPNGAEFEALITDEGGGVNIDWRAVWEVASVRTADGWSSEFSIPWRTLRYPDALSDEPWGINVLRVIRHKNEEVQWQSWEREGGGLHRVSRAGHLTGLSDLPRPSLNVEMKPFLLSGRTLDVDDGSARESSSKISTGVDLKTELLPGLLLDLTVNTDFAQVEVDDAQVNLTRFNLFFPEKRDFFLENSGVFDFGTAINSFGPPAYQMFFSRQIGISEDGEVPILGGARVTGRLGSQTVGLLSVLTESVPGVERERFSVARLKRDVGESNYVGGMVADRRGNGPANTSTGIDAQFVIGDAWIWNGFGARSFTEGVGGEGYAYGVGYNYSGDLWSSFFNHYGVGAEVESAAGFVTRNDFRKSELYNGRTWRLSALGLRDVQFNVGGTYASTVSDNRLQEWSAGFFLSTNWDASHNLNLIGNVAEAVVDEEFELADGVSVPVGRYDNDHLMWFGSTNQSRMVSLGSNGRISRFFGGSLVSAGATLTAAPSAQVGLSFAYNRNVIDVPAGDFTADLFSMRGTYSFSTRMSTNVLVQYNSLDRDFSTNVRFNFVHRPGSDFFIVFTENRGDGDRVWNLSDRGLVMKVTYLARL